MARPQINALVTEVSGVNGAQKSVSGAVVQIYQAGGTTPVTVYNQSTGGTTVAAPFTTNTQGQVVHTNAGTLFADPQDITVLATKNGQSYQVNMPLVSIPVTAPQLGDDSVGADELISSGVTADAVGSLPAARATRVAASSMNFATGGSGTNLTMPTEDFDTDTIHDISSNTDRLTCKTAGVYIVTGRIVLAYVATGSSRILSLMKNGSAVEGNTFLPTDGFGTQYARLNTIVKLAVNDYIALNVYHDRGSNLTGYGELAMAWIGKG